MSGPGTTTMPSSALSRAARRYDSARARARLRNMTATATTTMASASAATVPAAAEIGSARRMTCCEWSPSAARAGALAAANAASSASAAVLHPASATVAEVSSQVAWRGSSRAATGRAATPARAGIASGRYSSHTRLLRFLVPLKIAGLRILVAGQQTAQQPGISSGEPGHEPAEHCIAVVPAYQRLAHPASGERCLIDRRVGEAAPGALACQQAHGVQPGHNRHDRAVGQFSPQAASEPLPHLGGAQRPACPAQYSEDL